MKVQTVPSDNGRAYCRHADRYPHELLFQREYTEHRKTTVRRPQSN